MHLNPLLPLPLPPLPRWLVLKDSFLVYIRSDRRTIAGVLLFDEGTSIKSGSIQTSLLFGLEIITKTRYEWMLESGIGMGYGCCMN